MTPKKALNADNLEALGAKRLAELLMDIAEGDAATKRRLRLELAAKEAAPQSQRAGAAVVTRLPHAPGKGPYQGEGRKGPPSKRLGRCREQ